MALTPKRKGNARAATPINQRRPYDAYSPTGPPESNHRDTASRMAAARTARAGRHAGAPSRALVPTRLPFRCFWRPNRTIVRYRSTVLVAPCPRLRRVRVYRRTCGVMSPSSLFHGPVKRRHPRAAVVRLRAGAVRLRAVFFVAGFRPAMPIPYRRITTTDAHRPAGRGRCTHTGGYEPVASTREHSVANGPPGRTGGRFTASSSVKLDRYNRYRKVRRRRARRRRSIPVMPVTTGSPGTR